MRATTLIATAMLTALAVALSSGRGSVAAGTETPPAAVPGPQRPIVEIPPEPVVVDKRRPPQNAAVPLPSPLATPATPAPLPPASVLEGGFRPGAPGEKAAGRAIARLATSELKLEKLSVTPGRDLELWLVAIDRLGNGEDLTDTKRVSLGKLKKAEGDQSYRLPPEIDLRVYRNVVVWSRRERSARAHAPLAPQAAQRTVKQTKQRIR